MFALNPTMSPLTVKLPPITVLPVTFKLPPMLATPLVCKVLEIRSLAITYPDPLAVRFKLPLVLVVVIVLLAMLMLPTTIPPGKLLRPFCPVYLAPAT